MHAFAARSHPSRPCPRPDNYMEVVHGGLELEINPPYLMYTHGDDEVRRRRACACMLRLHACMHRHACAAE